MYLGVEPPFVRPMPSEPPLAPVPSWWTLTWVASIISHSKSGSSMTASSSLSHTPLSLHLQNLRWVFFQQP